MEGKEGVIVECESIGCLIRAGSRLFFLHVYSTQEQSRSSKPSGGQ